jgi:hypothetical protein
MKNMTFSERVNMVTTKTLELMSLVCDMRRGNEIDFNRIRELIRDIHEDELTLIGIIDEYDLEKRHDIYTIEIPSFMK